MGFVRRNTQDEPSARVILFDEPVLRNRNRKRMQFGEDAMASSVSNPDARSHESTATVASGGPGAHRDTAAASIEQREEAERGWPLVIVVDLGYRVYPAVLGPGQPGHMRDYLRRIVDSELHSLDLSKFARHA